MDGFQIKKTEDISILHPDDIVHICYFPSFSERKMEIPKQSEVVKTKSTEGELETKELDTFAPIIIDHSGNQSEEGYIIPTNKIVRFTKDENDEIDALPMRVAPSVSYHGENTNTPTVNARPSKKRTRRGKRAGKKTHPKPLGFLDFISNEAPTIMSSLPPVNLNEVYPLLNETNETSNETNLISNEMTEVSNEMNNNNTNSNNTEDSITHISPSISETNNLSVEANPAITEATPAITKATPTFTKATPAFTEATPVHSASIDTNCATTDYTKQEEHLEILKGDKAESKTDSAVSVTSETEKASYFPCIQDIIRYQTSYLDPESKCPIVKEVEGRVMK